MDEDDFGKVAGPKKNATQLQSTSHSFPSNAWIHKITKGKESDRCDLWKALRLVEGRSTMEGDLPEQTLGHIHHTIPSMEIPMHLRREMSSDDLERIITRNGGLTIPEYHTRYDMECCKSP